MTYLNTDVTRLNSDLSDEIWLYCDSFKVSQDWPGLEHWGLQTWLRLGSRKLDFDLVPSLVALTLLWLYHCMLRLNLDLDYLTLTWILSLMTRTRLWFNRVFWYLRLDLKTKVLELHLDYDNGNFMQILPRWLRLKMKVSSLKYDSDHGDSARTCILLRYLRFDYDLNLKI